MSSMQSAVCTVAPTVPEVDVPTEPADLAVPPSQVVHLGDGSLEVWNPEAQPAQPESTAGVSVS